MPKGIRADGASSNTGGNSTSTHRKGQFVKGDPRINRNGRPKSFDQLRALAQIISHEIITAKSGEKASWAEVILRQMAADPRQRQLFLEIAFGKVPQVNVIKGEGEGENFLQVTVVHTKPDGKTPLPEPADGPDNDAA